MTPRIEARDKVTFIGSLFVPPGTQGEILGVAFDLSVHKQMEKGQMIVAPQLPQLGPRYYMNSEAMAGLPFVSFHSESPADPCYDLQVTLDDGARLGDFIVPDSKRELFDQIHAACISLAGGGYARNPSEGIRMRDEALSTLVSLCPGMAELPVGIQIIIEAAEQGRIDLTNRTVKIQIAGPINTAYYSKVQNESGEFEDKLIVRSYEALATHSLLILARSILWAKALEKYGCNVVCSFDEPCFKYLDQERGGPRLRTALDTYELLWANPDYLPYSRMIHVCDVIVPEFLEYVDLLNWDVYKNAELAAGNEPALKAFILRGGRLVTGVVPTNPDDTRELIKQIGGDGQIKTLFKDNELRTAFVQACAARVEKVIKILTNEKLPPDSRMTLEEVMRGLMVSPQCGLGGMLGDVDAPEYSALVYDLIYQVAAVVGLI
ncbi:MAG TPA: hypothetical protein VMW41_06190 [Candidatus Bathyarchaeia archaeon]|nr:hypothetical protein [Candidatus Bathyarchaeia archaeon]